MVCGIVYLSRCFHPETNAFQGIASSSEDGGSEYSALDVKSVWSQEFVAHEIAHLGMMEKIRAHVDTLVARVDAWEFLSQK
eukprot:scaffold61685_cov54-Attheya_sp.AAC.3